MGSCPSYDGSLGLAGVSSSGVTISDMAVLSRRRLLPCIAIHLFRTKMKIYAHLITVLEQL